MSVHVQCVFEAHHLIPCRHNQLFLSLPRQSVLRILSLAGAGGRGQGAGGMRVSGGRNRGYSSNVRGEAVREPLM